MFVSHFFAPFVFISLAVVVVILLSQFAIFRSPFFFHFSVLFSWCSPQMIVPIVVVVHIFFCSISHLVALTSRRLNLHIFNSFSCLVCFFFAAAAAAFALLWYIRVYLVVANWTLAAERVHFHKSILNGLLRCDVTATVVWVKSQFVHIVYVRLIFYSVSCRHLPFAFFLPLFIVSCCCRCFFFCVPRCKVAKVTFSAADLKRFCQQQHRFGFFFRVIRWCSCRFASCLCCTDATSSDHLFCWNEGAGERERKKNELYT